MTYNEYVILHLTSHDLPLGELVKQSGYTRPTVERHLKSLRRWRFVEQRPGSGHYQLTVSGELADRYFREDNPILFSHLTQFR